MKKIFTLSCILATALSATAQEAIKVGPDYVNTEDGQGMDLSLLGEKLSTNKLYVSGQEQNELVPFVWNIETGDVKTLVISDNVRMPIEWDDDFNEVAWEEQAMTRSGSFRSVSPEGIAVGAVTDQQEYISYPVMFDATTGEHTYLYREDGEAGGEGYAITDDGKTILGFYFDASWITTPCLWTNDGQTRTDLPVPSAEETGFPIDYASARWITPDGSRVLGYVQDFYSGAWVSVVWNRQEDGTYVPDCTMAKTLYQTRPYTEVEGPDGWPLMIYDEIVDPKPYTQLEPLCMSDNGEWVVCVVADYVDEDNDQNPLMAAKNIRYNLTTGQCDVIEAGGETSKIEIFGIANDGTAAGRLTGELDWESWSQPIDAVVWPAGSQSLVKLQSVFEGDPYADGWTASALSSISADGKTVMGYASDEMGFQTTFVCELPASLAGLHSVEAPAAEGVAYDLAGRRTSNNAASIRIIGGKKVVK